MRLFSLLSAAVLAATVSAQGDDLNIKDVSAQYRLYGFVNCNGDETKQVLRALKDKDRITGVDSSQKINWHGAAAIDFFG
jgi:hypothetical protein